MERPVVEREERGQVWAVLVAGSRGWDNYRHQADVCHAYQVREIPGGGEHPEILGLL